MKLKSTPLRASAAISAAVLAIGAGVIFGTPAYADSDATTTETPDTTSVVEDAAVVDAPSADTPPAAPVADSFPELLVTEPQMSSLILADTTKPTASLSFSNTAATVYGGRTYLNNTAQIVVSATDETGLTKVVLNFYDTNGVLKKSTQVAANGALTATHTVTIGSLGLPDGLYNVKANSSDGTNTSSTITPQLVIDNSAPRSYSKETYPKVNGRTTIENRKLADDRCVNGVFVNGVWFDKSNNPWSDHNDITQGKFGGVEGKNTIQVLDCAGNLSDADATLAGVQMDEFIIDTTGPTCTIKDGFIGTRDAMVFQAAACHLYDPANVAKATIVNSSGTFVKNFTPNMWSDLNDIKPGGLGIFVEGPNVITLGDQLGNSAPSFTITLDVTKPVIITPTVDTISGTHTFSISQIEANPAKAYVELLKKDSSGKYVKLFGEWKMGTNDLGFTVDSLLYPDGTYYIKTSSWDLATFNTSKIFEFKIVNTPTATQPPVTDPTPTDPSSNVPTDPTTGGPVDNSGNGTTTAALGEVVNTAAVKPAAALAQAGTEVLLAGVAAGIMLLTGFVLFAGRSRRNAADNAS